LSSSSETNPAKVSVASLLRPVLSQRFCSRPIFRNEYAIESQELTESPQSGDASNSVEEMCARSASQYMTLLMANGSHRMGDDLL
jgi:hypothetical protein